jgi:hypothetical protein
MKLFPIVEGHGEVAAVPVLLRRLLWDHALCFGMDVGAPIRRTSSQFRREDEVRRMVRLALLQPDCAAVLLLFDGEDDCPYELAAKVRNWAQAEAGNALRSCHCLPRVRDLVPGFGRIPEGTLEYRRRCPGASRSRGQARCQGSIGRVHAQVPSLFRNGRSGRDERRVRHGARPPAKPILPQVGQGSGRPGQAIGPDRTSVAPGRMAAIEWHQAR